MSTPEFPASPSAEQTFAELAAEFAKLADGSDAARSELISKVRKFSRPRLLALHPAGEGHSGPSSLVHLVAQHGQLDKFIAKLSKPAAKSGEGEPSEEASHAALLEALRVEAVAQPEASFHGKTMNVFGAAAAGGHLAQIPDSCFERSTLLPAVSEHSIHFLQVAKAAGKLLEVPAFVWKRLQRLQTPDLAPAETALLAELLTLHAEVVAHYCALLEANPGIYHRDIPPDLKTEPALRAVQRAHELKHYEQNAIPFEHLPQRFQEGEDALHAWSRPWIRLLAQEPVSFDRIPSQLRESQEALDAWAKPWIHKLASEPVASYQIPPQLRHSQDALNARKEFHCKAVRDGDEQALRAVPQELREEPELKEAMQAGWSAWLAKHGLDSWNSLPEAFRLLPALVEQAAALWIDRIRTQDIKWPDIHEEVRALPSVRHAWLERQKLPAQMAPSLAEVAAQPTINRTTLDLWRHSNHWNRQRAMASLVELRNAPWHYANLDEAARNHPMIEEAAYSGIAELIRRHWSYFQVAPEDFRTEPDLLELAATEWSAALSSGQIPWERIPEELHEAPSLKKWKEKHDAKERKQERQEKQLAVQGRVMANPQMQDAELTKKELKNAGIRKLRTNYWVKRITEDRLQFLQVPESLLDQELIQNAMRRQWGPLVHQNPAGFDELPERVRADVGIQRVHRIATRPPGSESE